MKINHFILERYFAKHEFTAKYLLSSSDCDGYALKYVLDGASTEELALWENMTLGYTESEGNPLLREIISTNYKTQSIDNIIVATPGELNFISMNVLLTSSDHVITVAPCYQSLYEVVKSIGSELSNWYPSQNDWTFDTKKLEQLIKPNTKLIILNFPHNPTGSYLSLDQLNEIVRIARENNIYIFSDEMYHKLMVSDMLELPSLCDLYEKGISLWGASKTFGLAGLRTGWLVSQDKEFLARVVSYKDYLSICNSAPSEILTIMALNNMDRFLLPNLKKVKRNITLFTEFAKNQNVIEKFVPPRAGTTSFVKLKIDCSALEFSDHLVAETGIMTVPAEMFEYEGKYIRVGFGRANFPEMLKILGEYFKKFHS